MSQPPVVVLGAGVIGLTTALQLIQGGEEEEEEAAVADPHPHRRSVTIVARDFPAPFETIDPRNQINYTSAWAGAHYRPILPTNSIEAKEHDLALRTLSRLRGIGNKFPGGETGLTFLKGVEYIESPSPRQRDLTLEEARGGLGLGENFRFLEPDDGLPEGVKWGCEYDSWCLNPMVYCSFLLRRFVHLGGKIVRREVRDPSEIFAMKDLGGGGGHSPQLPPRVVVNASGVGFGDEKVFITRGQTCLVANDIDRTITRQNADGSWSFCIPRGFHGGTVIGGTREVGNWDPEPDPKVRVELLHKFKQMHPEILDGASDFTIKQDIVGRRPTRKGGIRLEREEIAENKSVIHAYGLGSRGYELSWGVAEEVAALLGKSTSGAPASKL